jgi:hypothetical protein
MNTVTLISAQKLGKENSVNLNPMGVATRHIGNTERYSSSSFASHFFSPTILQPVFDLAFSPMSSAKYDGAKSRFPTARHFVNSQVVLDHHVLGGGCRSPEVAQRSMHANHAASILHAPIVADCVADMEGKAGRPESPLAQAGAAGPAAPSVFVGDTRPAASSLLRGALGPTVPTGFPRPGFGGVRGATTQPNMHGKGVSRGTSITKSDFFSSERDIISPSYIQQACSEKPTIDNANPISYADVLTEGAKNYSREDIIAFGGIPEQRVSEVRSSAKIEAQATTDHT